MTLDRLILTPLKIRAEIYLRIGQCLLSSVEDNKEIKNVYYMPTALGQCQFWLRADMPNCSLSDMGSTAAAARKVKGNKTEAAIGSSLAAECYGLKILADSIEDNALNMTRFLVIGKGKSEPTGKDKTSLVFTTPDAPGALHRALASFAERKINLSKIESHAVKERLQEYQFFVDLIGHENDDDLQNCLLKLRENTTFIKILGSYPQVEGGL